MIEILSNVGWVAYCNENIVTDIFDVNGFVLKTGDFVEVLDKRLYWAGYEDYLLDTAIVVFDEFRNFLDNDNFYISGWKNLSHTNEVLFKKIYNNTIKVPYYRIN